MRPFFRGDKSNLENEDFLLPPMILLQPIQFMKMLQDFDNKTQFCQFPSNHAFFSNPGGNFSFAILHLRTSDQRTAGCMGIESPRFSWTIVNTNFVILNPDRIFDIY